LKKEIQILLTAFMFYTRLPVYKFIKHEEKNLSLSVKYLPVVGWVVGAFSGLMYIVSQAFFSEFTAVVFAILTSVLITGAFHEDGLADTCDAFGGGWTKEKILLIMKDSNIGVYGTVALIIFFLLKIGLLIEIYSLLEPFQIILFTISVHSLSRFVASTFIYTHKYVRVSEDSKAKKMIQRESVNTLVWAGILAVIPLLLLGSISHWGLLLLLFPLFMSKYFLGNYFNKWIDGYTGDCLGATQQVTEVIFYITFTIFWKFI